MIKQHLRLALLATTVGLCGCTTTTLKIAAADETASAGAPYSLYFTQFDVTVTRTITKCGPLTVRVATDAKPTTLPDPAARYVIDLNSLGDDFKTSDVKVEYHGHDRLKSLNASAEDKSEAVLKSVTSSLGALVQIGLTAGAAAPASNGCVDRLAAFRMAEEAVKLETELGARSRREVRDIAIQVAAAKGPEQRRLQQKLAAATLRLEHTGDRLAEADRRLAAAKADITDVQTFKWPLSGTELTGANSLPLETLQAWSAGEVLPGGRTQSEREAAAQKRLDVALALEVRDPATGTYSAGKAAVADPKKGLPYRHARPGRLTVKEAEGKLNAEFPAELPQLGAIYYFPVRNRPFENNTFTLALTEGGELQSVGYVQKAARAEGVANTAKAVVDQASATYTASLDAETKALTREAERLKAEKAVADATTALNPSAASKETVTLNEQIALLNARKSLADADRPELNAIKAEVAMKTAQLELVKANEGLNPSQVAADTTRLTNEIANLKAQQEQKRLTSEAAANVEAINSELTVKRAQLELLKIEADLAKARAEASDAQPAT